MTALALFPLDLVLFPGMQVQLHIFEERYKLMINECVDAQSPFGIVLIRRGRAAGDPAATPFDVGCAAQITQVQRLPLERMNILVTGQRRFRIKSLDHSRPYLLGEVEYFSPSDHELPSVRLRSRQLRPLIIRYLEILSAADDKRVDLELIPRQPRAVAQLACILLQTDNGQKQALLAMDSLAQLTAELLELYRVEVSLLKTRLTPPGDDFNIGPFSSN